MTALSKREGDEWGNGVLASLLLGTFPVFLSIVFRPLNEGCLDKAEQGRTLGT